MLIYDITNDINMQLYLYVNYFHLLEFTWLVFQNVWESAGLMILEINLAGKKSRKLKIICIFTVEDFHDFMFYNLPRH